MSTEASQQTQEATESCGDKEGLLKGTIFPGQASTFSWRVRSLPQDKQAGVQGRKKATTIPTMACGSRSANLDGRCWNPEPTVLQEEAQPGVCGAHL